MGPARVFGAQRHVDPLILVECCVLVASQSLLAFHDDSLVRLLAATLPTYSVNRGGAYTLGRDRVRRGLRGAASLSSSSMVHACPAAHLVRVVA